MTAISGIFANLPGLELIPPESIQRWLPTRYDAHVLENFLANRIIYPQTVALTKEDHSIDKAILQEYIVRNPSFFYNPLSHRLIIPLDLINHLPPINEIIPLFCNILNIAGNTQIFISEKNSLKLEGSITDPAVSPSEKMIEITLNGTKQTVPFGGVYHFSLDAEHIKLKIDGTNEIMVSGGKLGVTIDLRKKVT